MTPPIPRGKLDLRQILAWLQADGVIGEGDAKRLATRLASTASALHPLVRLAGADLKHAQTGAALDGPALTAWLAERLGLPHTRIDPLRVDAGRVAEVMSQAYAESRRALPLTVGPAEITIATCEPLDVAWVAEIEAHTRRRVTLVLAPPDDIARHTVEFYGLAQSVRTARRQQGDAAAPGAPSFEQLVDLKGKDALDANDQGVVQVVDWLWQYAFEQRASDIHLEPRREMGAIRLRIDGVLHTVQQVPAQVMAAMTARIKLLGRMDVVERRRPQDGRIKTRRPGAMAGQGEVEMRLSTLPTAFGEKVVMRIFDPGVADQSYEALGFGELAAAWRALTTRPHGIVLVTGPTGSGKTTTLYATLKRLATGEVNVCTLEDPIEMIEPAFNQTQVQPQLDLGFAEGLRALMRQDPDIIMVGEIRDLDTAEMAIQAALTGHLVLSTLHTNDAPSAIARLVDLGVQPYLISATVVGVLAQRLVRALCPACKQPLEEGAKTLAPLAKPWRLLAGAPFRPVGCPACRGTGYKGRLALYEMTTLDAAQHDAIHPRLDMAALRRAAVASGLIPLRVAGLAQVMAGRTSIDEVLAATPKWDDAGAAAREARG